MVYRRFNRMGRRRIEIDGKRSRDLGKTRKRCEEGMSKLWMNGICLEWVEVRRELWLGKAQRRK